MADKGIPALSIALVDDQRIVWSQGFVYVRAVKKTPAFIVTLVDRTSRRIVSHAVCFARTPEVLQAVVDTAPPAANYFSDAFNTYKELSWWGVHKAMYDKSETYSVEGDNAELRHYLARLTRKSRCFSKCIKALRRAVDLFVWCWNQRQLHKQQCPRYPSHLIDFVSCLV